MMKKNRKKRSLIKTEGSLAYDSTLDEFIALLEASRRATSRAVNSIMTATYFEIGWRIVEIEQGGKDRAEYGEEFLVRLGQDLTKRFGRGFQKSNLYQMRQFYLAYQNIFQTLSGKFDLAEITGRLPLSWSHYVKLLAVKKEGARKFYEDETLRGGWSVRQLDRQIGSLFYERALLSKNKAAMLKKARPQNQKITSRRTKRYATRWF